MQADQIASLAAFCRLADTGYRRDPDGYWVQDRPGLDRFAWRPDESDDIITGIANVEERT